LPSSGWSSPARIFMSVVLPTPFGPTNPTRSPARSSKPTLRNSGPSSKPRDSSVQLSNSMDYAIRIRWRTWGRGAPPAAKRFVGTRGIATPPAARPLLHPVTLSRNDTRSRVAQEPPHVLRVSGARQGFAEQRAGFVLATIKPQLVGSQEEQHRVVGVLAQQV